VYRENGMTFWK